MFSLIAWKKKINSQSYKIYFQYIFYEFVYKLLL